MSAELIEEILQLRRVPRRLRESARLRLREQSFDSLSSKAKSLREQRVEIDDWRLAFEKELRHKKSELAVNASQSIAKIDFWDLLQASEAREEIIQSKDAEDLVAKTLRLNDAFGQDGLVSASEFCSRALGWIVDEEVASVSTMTTHYPHPVVPVLSIGDFINAVGRIENEIEAHSPSAFVALNEGGMSVARIIREHMRLDAPVYGVLGAAETDLRWASGAERAPGGIVCVVGHVAVTGHTMTAAIRAAKQKFQTDRVYGALIAASDKALNGPLRSEKIVFHHKTTQETLIINDQVKVKQSGSESLIRAILDGSRVSVKSDILQNIRRYMADRYPVSLADL